MQAVFASAKLSSCILQAVFYIACMAETMRSGCPINLSMETLGDRWSLIIIRDIMFGSRRHYRELLSRSEEGIASNILADRLKKLMERGLLTRADDPSHK